LKLLAGFTRKKASTRRVNRKIADSTRNQRVFFSRYLAANYVPYVLNSHARIPVEQPQETRITYSAWSTLHMTWIRTYSRFMYPQNRLNVNRIPSCWLRSAYSTRRLQTRPWLKSICNTVGAPSVWVCRSTIGRLSGIGAGWDCTPLVSGGGGICAGGGVPLGAVPALSWRGEVSLGGKHIIIITSRVVSEPRSLLSLYTILLLPIF